MDLSHLKKSTTRGIGRLGLGHGSGRGKTAGRGTKGQNARSGVSLTFEGGALSLIKRLPFRRGKGRNKVFKNKPVVLNTSALNSFAKGDVVDLKSVVAKKLIIESDALRYGVKILGDGALGVALTVKLVTSKTAREKIEAAGGSVVNP